MAQLSPSVPQEVNATCSGRHPRAAATRPRPCSTRSLAFRPSSYWAEGLPKFSVSASAIAWATWGGTGVVAAWSK